VVGAEAEHSKRRAKRAGRDPGWSAAEAPPPDRDLDDGTPFILREEVEAGLAQAATIFSLYENARRHAAGEGLDAHRDRIARLWHGFARVAERNPYAWTREAPSLETIRDAGPDNKMNAWPYTKRLCANMVVDLGAAVIVCSAERAQRLGVPRDRWVYLRAATDCMATPMMSHRVDFLDVPALGLAGARAFELAGLGPEDVGPVDLYSCFPAAVQVAAEALGFGLDRELTVTGGLAYAGGPFNSYVLHAIATTMARLRAERGRPAFVSSVGGSFNKHAFAIYSAEPPETGFRYADLDDEARALPRRACVFAGEGDGTVETWALRYHEGRPARATLACLLDDGRRTWVRSDDAALFAEMTARETCGRRVRVKAGELQGLD
jgi:acetyl-CoA C-acetyltransferase